MADNISKYVRMDGQKNILISTATLRSILGVSQMMISKWSAMGMPKRDRGWWCLAEVLAWRASGQYKDNPDADKKDLSLSARKLKAEADYKELKTEREKIMVAALKGEYINRDDIVQEWTRRVLNLKTALMAMPKQVSREFLDIDIRTKVEEKVKVFVVEMLNEYAKNGKYTPNPKK
jgi:phage terminase Nu1 subunit (DNA packaging protein)